jgi:hypothetical protein
MKCEACKGTGTGGKGKPCFECDGTGSKCDVCGEACDSGVDMCAECEEEETRPDREGVTP